MNRPLLFSIFIAFYVYIYLFLQLTETSSQILYRPNEVPVLQCAYFRTRLHVLAATLSRRIWLRWIRIAYEFLFSYILHISRYEHSLIMTVCYKLGGILFLSSSIVGVKRHHTNIYWRRLIYAPLPQIPMCISMFNWNHKAYFQQNCRFYHLHLCQIVQIHSVRNKRSVFVSVTCHRAFREKRLWHQD